ncbi:NERD domain-containing protein [Thalassoglobus sp.]|uniref:nuclease-related domain-containing DEAD/DEAH box helicase n=1 Tax=Thalassoglobus sp. TaxID=2795869 RepID=UPI003AA9649E
MARMYPEIDPDSITTESEKILYRVFQRDLPDEFVCFHSYPWLRPNRDLLLREGEADFVILHQELGMLVVEAKGGQIDYQAPLWKRKVGKRWEVIQDPFEQAKRSMHRLNEIIEESANGDLLSSDYTYGFCSAFPTHDYVGRVPLNADPSIVISQSDLDSIQVKIEKAFASWARGKTALSNESYSQLVNALLPQFRLFRPIAVNLQSDFEQIKELTDEQSRFFKSIYGAKRVFVEGVAGSGKTLLALDRARDFARQGMKTLLVCYNKQLASWWKEQFESSELDRQFLHNIEILNFHSLARRLAKRASIAFEVPSEKTTQQTFWRDEVPAIIEQSAVVLMDDDFQYDAIVLDEGQDFHTSWWDCLNYCLLKNEDNGVFYAFCDPDQSLWDWSNTKPSISFGTPVTLGINCRNTRAIAQSSSTLAHIKAEVYGRSPLGLKPTISRPPTIEASKGILLQAIRDLTTKHKVKSQEIVLIGARSHAQGSLFGRCEIEDILLTDSATEWRSGKGVLVTTSRSFKGLEADAVIVYDIGNIGSHFSITDLYVACTRARSYLHLIVHETETAKVIQEAIENGWDQASGATGNESA